MIKKLLTLVLLVGSGCGVLQSFNENPIDRYFYKINKDPRHVESCGPKALYKALRELGHDMAIREISYTIQRGGDITRSILALFDQEARSITWPSEIIKFLEKRGYTISTVKDIEALTLAGNVALVLVRNGLSLDYHWMCSPSDGNIKAYFGGKTEIKLILLINQKSP